MIDSLPTFPSSKKLTLQDKQLITSIISKYKPYSDFNFLSLWSYDTDQDLALSTYKDNLVICMRDYITSTPVFSLIGTTDIIQTCELILKNVIKGKHAPYLKYVPQETASQLINTDMFTVQEDRDNFDYIYSINALNMLSGVEMHKLRNYVNRFKDLYPEISSHELNLLDANTQKEMMQLFDKWAIMKGKDYDSEHERIAIMRALTSARDIGNLFSIGLYSDNTLIAFFIGDTRDDMYAQGHFAKALTAGFHGITSYLYHKVAAFLYEKGYKYINLEQDLGIMGLRLMKEQMGPIEYLKKYIISLK